MDDDGSGTLSLPEFAKACRDFRIGISDENVPILFGRFDRNKDGTISYDEFLYTIRGPFGGARLAAVKKAFNAIDLNENGILEIDEIKSGFNATRHPAVLQGKRTKDSVLCEFLETLQAHHNLVHGLNSKADEAVTMEQFVDYYHNISATIDSDEAFLMIVNNSWDIRGDTISFKKFDKSW